jgi:hypothetical protein
VSAARLVPAIAMLVACGAPPPPAPIARPAPPPASTSVTTVTSAAVPEGAPESPGAMRWIYLLPPFHGQPWRSARLLVEEDGAASWESQAGEGDGDVDESLEPQQRRPDATTRCAGKLALSVHRRLVEAARQAMNAGCNKPTRVDPAATTLSLREGGVTRSCEVGRSGGSYLAFERAREDVVSLLCRK